MRSFKAERLATCFLRRTTAGTHWYTTFGGQINYLTSIRFLLFLCSFQFESLLNRPETRRVSFYCARSGIERGQKETETLEAAFQFTFRSKEINKNFSIS